MIAQYLVASACTVMANIVMAWLLIPQYLVALACIVIAYIVMAIVMAYIVTARLLISQSPVASAHSTHRMSESMAACLACTDWFVRPCLDTWYSRYLGMLKLEWCQSGWDAHSRVSIHACALTSLSAARLPCGSMVLAVRCWPHNQPYGHCYEQLV